MPFIGPQGWSIKTVGDNILWAASYTLPLYQERPRAGVGIGPYEKQAGKQSSAK